MLVNTQERDGPTDGPAATARAHHGHAHFWERAALSRRKFIGAAAGVTGLAMGAGLWTPQIAFASSGGAAPRPIPGGIQPFGPGTEVFHVFLPGHAGEPSTITDLNGFVGIANVRGMGTGTNTATGETKRLIFDVDNRFMKGEYVGLDGLHHHGTFGFV